MPASRDYLESVYKEAYKAELDRSEKLDGQINLPTGIVTVFLGASAFYFEHPPAFGFTVRVSLFYGTMIAYLLAVLATIFCMVRSYTRYRYALIPSPLKIDERVEELRVFYQNYYGDAHPAVDEDIKKEIQGELIGFYRDAADENRKNNVKRTEWLFRTTLCIVLALLLLMLSRVIFYAIANPPKPQKIQIVSTPAEPSRLNIAGAKSNDIQKVQVLAPPSAQGVELTNRPLRPKIEITAPAPIQGIEIVVPNNQAQ